MKRITIATFFGLVAGAICASLLFSFGLLKYTPVALGWVLLNRAVMGFAIGVSALKLRWAWNGVVVGVAVGSIFSYFIYMQLGAASMAAGNLVGNALFGLLIEFFTTVVFKQPPLGSRREVGQAVSA